MNAKKDLNVYLRNKVFPNFSFSQKIIKTDDVEELFNKYDKWKGQSEFNLFSLVNFNKYKGKILNKKKTENSSSRNKHVKNQKIKKNFKKNIFHTSIFSNQFLYLTDRNCTTQKNITCLHHKSKNSKIPLKTHLEFQNPIINYISKIIRNHSTNNNNPSSISKIKNTKRPLTSSCRNKKIKLINVPKYKLNFHDFTYKKLNTLMKKPPINKKTPKDFFSYEKSDDLNSYLGQQIINENNGKLVLRGLALDKNGKAYYEKCQQMNFINDRRDDNVHSVNNLSNYLSNNFRNNISSTDNKTLKKKNFYLGLKHENKENQFIYSLKGLVNNTQPILINTH